MSTVSGRGGSLGINHMRVPAGRTTCPFHAHSREDEAFFVISGRGVLRYGEDIREIGPGDCISCPAGTGISHQIANPFEDDRVYLAIRPAADHRAPLRAGRGVRFGDRIAEVA